jgi:hypothetical protein
MGLVEIGGVLRAAVVPRRSATIGVCGVVAHFGDAVAVRIARGRNAPRRRAAALRKRAARASQLVAARGHGRRGPVRRFRARCRGGRAAARRKTKRCHCDEKRREYTSTHPCHGSLQKGSATRTALPLPYGPPVRDAVLSRPRALLIGVPCPQRSIWRDRASVREAPRAPRLVTGERAESQATTLQTDRDDRAAAPSSGLWNGCFASR